MLILGCVTSWSRQDLFQTIPPPMDWSSQNSFSTGRTYGNWTHPIKSQYSSKISKSYCYFMWILSLSYILSIPLGKYCISQRFSRLPFVAGASSCLFQAEQNTSNLCFLKTSPWFQTERIPFLVKIAKGIFSGIWEFWVRRSWATGRFKQFGSVESLRTRQYMPGTQIILCIVKNELGKWHMYPDSPTLVLHSSCS